MAHTLYKRDGGGGDTWKEYYKKINDPLWYNQNVAVSSQTPGASVDFPRNIDPITKNPIYDARTTTTLNNPVPEGGLDWIRSQPQVKPAPAQTPDLPNWENYSDGAGGTGDAGYTGNTRNVGGADYSHLTKKAGSVTAPEQNIMELYGNIPTDVGKLEELFRKATGAEFDAKDKGQSMLLNEMNKTASQRALEREAFENKAAANRIMTGSSRGMTEAQNMLAARDAEQAHQALMMEQLIEQKNLTGQRGAAEAKNIVDAEQLGADRMAQQGKAAQDLYTTEAEKYAAELGLKGMEYQAFMQAAAERATNQTNLQQEGIRASSAETVAGMDATTRKHIADLESRTNRYMTDANFKLQNYATEMGLGSNEFNTLGTVLAQGISVMSKEDQRAFYEKLMGVIIPEG